MQPPDTLMIPVKSSTISAIGHDEETGTLIVAYHSGTYLYDNVPRSEYDALMAADSKGAHIHQHIKGKYPHTKMPNPALRENGGANAFPATA